MKKVLSALLVGILVSSLSYSQTKKNVDVDDFTSVSFGVSGNLTLEQGKNFKVVIEGDEELLEAIYRLRLLMVGWLLRNPTGVMPEI